MAQAKDRTSNPIKNTSLAHGVGRRKKSIARAWLKRGSGKMTINGKPTNEYFDTEITRLEATKPFKIISASSGYDVDINVVGGGLWGQAGAVCLGVSRAFLAADESIRAELRKHGLLTVDARIKERKKPGQPGARRKFQFVKR